MPLQKWRKKSEHCRKIYTFADCFARENAGLLRSARNDAKRALQQQLNNSTTNN